MQEVARIARIAVGAAVALAQVGCSRTTYSLPGPPPRSVAEFVRHLVVVFPAETGTSVEFTGEFATLPSDLERELGVIFPDIDFSIAKMLYLHWGLDPVDLLIAKDKKTGRIVTYLWSLWFTSPTSSFGRIFQSRQWVTVQELRGATVAVAKLVAHSMDGRIGDVSSTHADPTKFLDTDTLGVQLINSQGHLWRVMTLHFTQGAGGVSPEFVRFVQTEESGGATFS